VRCRPFHGRDRANMRAGALVGHWRRSDEVGAGEHSPAPGNGDADPRRTASSGPRFPRRERGSRGSHRCAGRHRLRIRVGIQGAAWRGEQPTTDFTDHHGSHQDAEAVPSTGWMGSWPRH
jgi:hypothetical protein